MKRVVLLLMSFMTSITFAMAQTDFPYPELLSKDSVELLTVHNGQLITGKKDKKRNIYLAVNNKVDTLKLNSSVRLRLCLSRNMKAGCAYENEIK